MLAFPELMEGDVIARFWPKGFCLRDPNYRPTDASLHQVISRNVSDIIL